MNMDGYEKFKKDLMEELKKVKAYEDYNFKIIMSSKANKENSESITAQSKMVKEGYSRCFPLFEIQVLYEKYLKNDCSMKAVIQFIDKHMRECNDIYYGASEFKQCVDNFYNYEYIKDRIVLKLINFKINEKYLEDIIYKKLSDLAIVYTVMMPKYDGAYSTVTVKKDIFNIWNISESELYDQALINMNRIDNVSSFADTMYKLSPMPIEYYEMLKVMSDGLYVVTNSTSINGASMFLCTDVQDKLAKIGKGFYVYPSSVHEMLFQIEDCMIEDKRSAVSVMKEITKGINKDILSNEDFLSDNIYYYDAINHTFTIASL